MQIGMIGLGRMGGNMVAPPDDAAGTRAWFIDRGADVVDEPSPGRARPRRRRSRSCRRSSRSRARCGSWSPPAGPPRRRCSRWPSCCDAGDTIIDGGNSFFKDDVRRAAAARGTKGIHYVDVGTSGGVWGTRARLLPDDRRRRRRRCSASSRSSGRSRPARGDIPPTAGPRRRRAPPRLGYLHCGPSGAGHFVKMVHNGIEYGLMQAYAEGFDIFRTRAPEQLPEEHRYDLNLADIAELWRRGSVVSSWLLDLTGIALAEDPTLSRLHRLRPGLGRRPLDGAGGDRRGGAGRGADRGALHPLPLAPGAHLRREDALGDAASSSAATWSPSKMVQKLETALTPSAQPAPPTPAWSSSSGPRAT